MTIGIPSAQTCDQPLYFQADRTMTQHKFKLYHRLTRLTGWPQRRLLFLLGALAGLALPPIGFLPILLLSIPALVWIWDEAKDYKAAFLVGWWWSFGFYATGFYWIANALLTDAARFGWMIPFATLGLGGLMAVFSAVGVTAAYVCRKPGPARIIWLAIFWTVGEWLRTFVLTGFPWNPMGSVWDRFLPVMQIGSLMGVHGLSFLTILTFGLLAAATTMITPRGRVVVALLALSFPIALGIWGQDRLNHAETGTVPGVMLRLVQPATPQAGNHTPEGREETLQTLVKLSRSDGFEHITHVIWPESAVLYDLTQDHHHRSIAALAAPDNGLLLAGAPRFKQTEDGQWQFWNSLLAIDPAATITGLYDKSHLVPFGEYVPLRGLIPLPRVVTSMGDFLPGPGPKTMVLPGLPPLGPVICYESIFPGEVVEHGANHPQWMVIVTNDGWFGNSTGPYQHFSAARMRAIEEGIPVARVANTGISGIIDPYGRVISQLPLGQQGILDAALPISISSNTLYATWYQSVLWIMLGCFSLIALLIRRYN